MISLSPRMIAEVDGPIGWVIFNNPERRNALTTDMWEALAGILGHFERDPAVRVIVLKGAGDKAFAAGADIGRFEGRTLEAEARDREHVNESLRRLESGKPCIAMINGYCLGGGLIIATHCDLRIAHETARLGLPAAKLGIGYPWPGMKKLLELVGPAVAKEICFTARQLTGTEAQSVNLVNRCVSGDSDLEETVRSYCAMISENAPLTISAAKGVLAELLKPGVDLDRERCDELVKKCMRSEDFVEGRRAFAEKRKPIFSGK